MSPHCHGSSNRIETFDVRFAYDWWEPASTGQPDQEQLAEATYDPGVGIFNDTNMIDPGSSISIPTNAQYQSGFVPRKLYEEEDHRYGPPSF